MTGMKVLLAIAGAALCALMLALSALAGVDPVVALAWASGGLALGVYAASRR